MSPFVIGVVVGALLLPAFWLGYEIAAWGERIDRAWEIVVTFT